MAVATVNSQSELLVVEAYTKEILLPAKKLATLNGGISIFIL